MTNLTEERITEILKSHPDIPYDKAKNQAKAAGIGERDFHESWRKVNKDFHDLRIMEIMDILRATKETDKATIKKELKQRGYLDDEIDLAYANIKTYRKTPSTKTDFVTSMAAGLLISLLFFGHLIIPEIISSGFDIFLIPPMAIATFFLGMIFHSSIAHQRRIKIIDEFYGHAILQDFEGHFANPSDVFDATQESLYLRETNLAGGKLGEGIYDGRKTLFGNHKHFQYVGDQFAKSLGRSKTTQSLLRNVYSFLGGKKKRQEHRTHFLVIQRLKRKLPQVHCMRKGLFGFHNKMLEMVTLDAGVMNEKYKVLVEKDHINAFHTLNPRVMMEILDRGHPHLEFMDVSGDFCIVGFQKVDYRSNLGINSPTVATYNNYQDTKKAILKYLDITSNIADTLERVIVDDGKGRSPAKEL